jgi:ubiquinone/menaquinone biosynthesis C-methylase UbiE
LTVLKGVQEAQRLNLQHYALKHDLQGNFLAPLQNPTTVLDVGCGTGRWVMEMAVQFPAANVVGLDLVPPAPAVSLGRGITIVPSNARFVTGDILQGLPFPDATFDFTYMRLMYNALPAQSWSFVVGELIRVTRPGGWVESLEALPFAVQQREGMSAIISWYSEALRKRGVDPLVALKIPHLLKSGGLVALTSREMSPAQSEPQGSEERIASRETALKMIDNLREGIVAAGITTPEVYEQTAVKARNEVQSTWNVGGFNMYINFGQKP